MQQPVFVTPEVMLYVPNPNFLFLKPLRRSKMRSKLKLSLIPFLSIGLIFSSPAWAQTTYNSGSTGANGAFPPAAIPTGATSIVMDLGSGNLTYKNAQGGDLGTGTVGAPDTAGVYNFTTFNLPAGVYLTFTPDSLNRPVQFLDSGDVTIAGTLSVSGQSSQSKKGGAGGPSGFNGGDGGGDTTSTAFPGSPGAGPAGGRGYNSQVQSSRPGSLLVSNQQLIPLFGGSGGGGGQGDVVAPGYGGGGGGGALLIASSGTVTLSGTINAVGGNDFYNGGNGLAISCPGSGGALRLVGTTVAGSGSVNVSGGNTLYQNNNYCPGNNGFVRIEGFTNTGINIVGASNFLRPTIPSPAIPSNLPSIKIASIGGIAAPANGTGGIPTQPDITFSQPQTGTVLLNVATSGIPINTTFTVRIAATEGKYSNGGEVTTFTGTTSATGGSASISLPQGTSIVDVYAAFQPTVQTGQRIEKAIGEKIVSAEVSARYRGASEVVYVTQSGKRIPASKIALVP
jgi:hypothetical protein